MAFSNAGLTLIKMAPGVDRSPLYDDVASALAVNTSSLTALGNTGTLARAVIALVDVYRNAPGAANIMSVGNTVSIAASSTTSLLTLQIQIIPTV